MDLIYLRKYLSTEVSFRQRWLWLGLSILVSLSYSLPVMINALQADYLVQDDARQHVFWMERFLDPGLYPNDFMADYFQSVAPWGYSTLYYGASQLGIDPFLFNKLLPPVLALITTVYFFLTVLKLFPSPVAGFVSTLLLNQNLWLRDDVISGTPVAFVYPFFTAFLYYLVGRSLFPCLGSIVLLGMFYPQMMLVAGGILFVRLFAIKAWKPQLAPPNDLRFYLLGLVAVVLLLLPYALETSAYGPVLTRAQAELMPTLGHNGWSRFFVDHFTNYWACGKRSGFLPLEWCDVSFSLPQVGLGLVLPLVILGHKRFSLAKLVDPEALLIPQTLAVSFGLFMVAHQMLFRMHLPNRYGEHSIRIVMAMGAGIALVIVWDRVLNWLQNLRQYRLPGTSFIAVSLTALIGTLLLANPYQLEFNNERFPIDAYIKGLYPEIYEFLAQQPPDILVASISDEVNNLPSFTQRSVFVGGGGYVLPYHLGYFEQAENRLFQTMRAQYTPNINVLKKIIRQNNIDFWLVDQNFTNPGYTEKEVFAQFPAFRKVLSERLRLGANPALARFAKACTIIQIDHPKKPIQLIDAACLLQQTQPVRPQSAPPNPPAPTP